VSGGLCISTCGGAASTHHAQYKRNANEKSCWKWHKLCLPDFELMALLQVLCAKAEQKQQQGAPSKTPEQ
jgi:hypothetical protein